METEVVHYVNTRVGGSRRLLELSYLQHSSLAGARSTDGDHEGMTSTGCDVLYGGQLGGQSAVYVVRHHAAVVRLNSRNPADVVGGLKVAVLCLSRDDDG